MEPGLLIIAPSAQRDLLTVWLTIAQDDPTAARRMLDLIRERVDQLSAMPKLGRARPELGEGKRSFVVDPYLIIYRPMPKGIIVLRVPHSAQDLSQLDLEGGAAAA